MDKKTIFIKTTKGEKEGASLSGDLRRLMSLIDNKSTVEELARRAPPSLREDLRDVLKELVAGDFIRDKDMPVVEPKIAAPKITSPKMAVPKPHAAPPSEELDFTNLGTTPTPPPPELAAKQKAEEVARARAEMEAAFAAAKAKASAEAEAKAEAKARQEAEAAARARAEAEIKAKQEAATREQAEAKAKLEAAARMRAEQEAARAKAELEAAARAKAEAEARVRAEIEAAARAKQEAEAKAKQEAEAARLKAEQEAARIRAELEAAAKAKAEAEAARIKAEQEAARVRAELEAAKARAEAEAKALAEAKARQEAEEKAKREAEAARLKAEQEAAIARAKAEAEEKARQEAEAKAKREAEERARQEAEEKAKREAEAKARREAEERARQEAEAARLKAEQEAAARARAEAEARAIAEAKARQEAEAAAKREAEERAQRAAEEAAREAAASAEPAAAPAFELNLNGFLAGTEPESSAEDHAAQARAEAEANARREAEQRAAAESKAAAETQSKRDAAAEMERLKAEAEAKADVARLKAEEEARRQAEEQVLAEEQAKAWAEAEQRAKAQAKIEAEQAAQQSALSQAKAAKKPVSRGQRKPLPLGKIAFSLVALALVAVVVVPYVYPLKDYIAPLEQRLSAQLKQPVHIGEMSAASLPPKLLLQKITVGNGQEVKIGNVILNFDLLSLLSDVKVISNAELQDVSIEGKLFDKQIASLKLLGGDAQYPVRHLTLQRVKIVSDEIALPTMSGIGDVDAQGAFSRVSLHSDNDKLGVDLQANQGRWQVGVDIKESSLPLLPDIVFSDLSAKGVLGDGEVNFTEVDAHIYNGILLGSAKLNWRKGWQLQGNLEAKTFELDKMFPKYGVEGELFGEGTFSMTSAKLSQLGEAPRLDGSFTVKKGTINGFDMVETARLLSRENLAGGRTHFDDMIGVVQVESHARHFRQLKIVSGMLSANGSFDVSPSNQLSGNFNAEIKMRAGNNQLTLYGALGEQKLRAGR